MSIFSSQWLELFFKNLIERVQVVVRYSLPSFLSPNPIVLRRWLCLTQSHTPVDRLVVTSIRRTAVLQVIQA